MSTSTDAEIKIPNMVTVRLNDLKPAVAEWIAKHPGVPLARLGRAGLKLALRPHVSKRNLKLVEAN